VYNAVLGPAAGIGGAPVAVLMCVPRAFETHSGSDGYYEVLVSGGYLNQCSTVTLFATAAGYQSFTQSVTVGALRAQPQRDFALQPLATTTPPARSRLYLPTVLRKYWRR